MNLFQVLFLAVVQGITEFLPISSSGHLALFQNLFGFSEAPILFDVLLHLGTLLAVVFYFRQDIFKESSKTWVLVLIGTLPAFLFGFLFEEKIEAAFTSQTTLGLSFLITSFLLFSTKLIKAKYQENNPSKSFIVGLFQALALLPGVSRSGATITGGLWQKLSPLESFKFSLYLSIPAVLGAVIFKMKDFSFYSQVDFINGFLGMVIAGLVGYFSLSLLKRILQEGKIFWFGFYCLILGAILLGL